VGRVFLPSMEDKTMKKGQNKSDSDKWMNSQRVLASELRKLAWRLKKEYPGVWRCQGIDDLLALAEDLPEISQKGIELRIQGWWQPELKLTFEPPQDSLQRLTEMVPAQALADLFASHAPSDGLHLCVICGDRYVAGAEGICPECLQQQISDDDIPY
jgi:hypothetical protein